MVLKVQVNERGLPNWTVEVEDGVKTMEGAPKGRERERETAQNNLLDNFIVCTQKSQFVRRVSTT